MLRLQKPKKPNRKGKIMATSLSDFQPYREWQILQLEGTKKQIKAYEDAVWKATPVEIQRLIIRSGGVRRQTREVWVRYHKIGYASAKKAGYKYHYLVIGKSKPKAKKK